ncbi:MAG: hypothetical protein PHI32_14830 [Dysgonamonadaceae bacterium]|nr:hypothetical protein [Dysgonamonadaceae bacterium]
MMFICNNPTNYFPLFTGNLGTGGNFTGLSLSSCSITSMPLFSWASMPLYCWAGSFSIIISGTTPVPSIIILSLPYHKVHKKVSQLKRHQLEG